MQQDLTFQRAALAEIGGATADLCSAGLDEHARVHRVRRRCKRLRSLFRLVRTGFAGYAFENATVRSIAQRLSDVRDAHASVEVFVGLLPHAERSLSRSGLHSVHEALIARRDSLARALGLTEELRRVHATFLEIGGRVGTWRLHTAVPDCTRAGVTASYQRARLQFAATSEHSSAELVHVWRKRTKDHRLQLDFLEAAAPWPKQRLRSLDSICRNLGEHHDLHVLTNALTTARIASSPELDFRDLMQLIERRQTALLSIALAYARPIFGETTGATCRSLHDAEAA